MCRAPYTTHQEQLSRCCGKKGKDWEWQKKKNAPSIPVTISIDAKEKGSALNSVIITRRFGVCLERKTSRMVPHQSRNFSWMPRERKARGNSVIASLASILLLQGVPIDESGCNKPRRCLFPCAPFLWIEKYDNIIFRKQKLQRPKRRLIGWFKPE